MHGYFKIYKISCPIVSNTSLFCIKSVSLQCLWHVSYVFRRENFKYGDESERDFLKLVALVFDIQDGRIWKEQLSTSVQRTADLPVLKDGAHLETEAARTKARPSPVSRSSLPSSISAPEHNLINLLDECKAAGD